MYFSRRAFTLIELLVVIAIIAILSVVVILTLNPAELLRQSRDANRLSDLDTLNHAIGLYSTDQSAVSGFSMGSSSVVYISIPDPTATSTAGDQCQGINLPVLATSSGYTYHCAASSTYRTINGTGWIPINFSSISSGSPLGNLPIDSTNQSSSHLYYTYTTNGTQYEITAAMESAKYKLSGASDAVSTDGGTKMSLAEKGTNLNLEPMDYGDTSLVGYWSLDEGSGTSTYDFSGTGDNAAWLGTQASPNSTYYNTAKVGAWAGNFDGSTNYTTAPDSAPLDLTSNVTISAWINPSVTGNGVYRIIVSKRNGGSVNYQIHISNAAGSNAGALTFYNGNFYGSSYVPPVNQWTFVVATVSAGNLTLYANGNSVYTNTGVAVVPSNGTFYIGYDGTSNKFAGLIDDVRVYNRALSASEVQAIYNAQH